MSATRIHSSMLNVLLPFSTPKKRIITKYLIYIYVKGILADTFVQSDLQ